MSIDGPQRGATQTDQPTSQRRTFLDLLSLEIRQSYDLWAGVVMREGCIVLYVADGGSMRSAEGMLVLTVHDGTAVGGIEGDAAFMPLCGQKLQQQELNAIKTRPGLRVEVTSQGQRLITACRP